MKTWAEFEMERDELIENIIEASQSGNRAMAREFGLVLAIIGQDAATLFPNEMAKHRRAVAKKTSVTRIHI